MKMHVWYFGYLYIVASRWILKIHLEDEIKYAVVGVLIIQGAGTKINAELES